MAAGALQATRTETVASVSAQIIASAVADGKPVPEEVLSVYREARTDSRALMTELLATLSEWARR